MTENEAHAQAFENGRKVGDAEGYARGKAAAFAEAGDLISRKALLDVIAETAEGLADCDQQNAAWALRKYAIRDIENAPTVGAVEVVRCKDCDYRAFDDAHKEYYCNCVYGMYGAIADNDFCSYGERRTDEEKD